MRTKTSAVLAALTAALIAISMTLLGGAPATAAKERPDSLGKDFWLAFMHNYQSEPELSLFISSPNDTSGTVSIPGIPWSKDFTVTPGSVTTVEIPPEVMLGNGSDAKPTDQGIHVTAADEVSVYGLNRIEYTTDAYMGLPVDVLGTSHIVLAWPAFSPASSVNDSEFAVVATEDGTEVTYTPTADTRSGVTAGTPKTTTLNAGQTLPVTSNTGDLSGTTVSSTKPISVFGGQMCGNVPSVAVGYCDHLAEQIPPVSTWGKEFLTVPLKTRLKGDTFRMIASEDATTVSVNGAPVATLDAGKHHQQIIEGQATISADKPILVAQYSNGQNYDGVVSDPFMMLIPPKEQFLSEYTFTTPESGFANNFVNVVTPTEAVGSVTIDGVDVPDGEFTQIGSTQFSGAQLDLTAGSHTMTSSKPFGIHVYGFDEYDSYGYPGGAAYAPINEVTGLTLTPATQKATVNATACVDAKVVNQDGKPLAGIPLTFSVTGVNPGTADGLTDANGIATHCYAGAKTGTDTVKAAYEELSATATIEWAAQSASPSASPTTQVLPAKAKRLPIWTKKVKSASVQMGSRDSIVLVKSIRTNKHGNIKARAICWPVGAAGTGEVRYCRATVSKKGKVTVHAGGYPKVRVAVKARAIPKPGQASQWLPSKWRKVWTIKR